MGTWERNCANTIVSFHQYCQVFYMNFKIPFFTFCVVRNDFLKKISKAVAWKFARRVLFFELWIPCFTIWFSFALGRKQFEKHCVQQWECKNVCHYCKWFEPRSISSLYSVIIWVRVVLKRTVVGDWRFDNLSKSHLLVKSIVFVRQWSFISLVSWKGLASLAMMIMTEKLVLSLSSVIGRFDPSIVLCLLVIVSQIKSVFNIGQYR